MAIGNSFIMPDLIQQINIAIRNSFNRTDFIQQIDMAIGKLVSVIVVRTIQ